MTGPKGANVVRLYFQKWNERKMNDAIDLFTDDCTYEDTLYPEKFVGKDQLRFHLLRVADALPASFAFVVDAVSEGEGEFVGVQWHVENDGKPLPFTRGSSMYTLDPTRTKIKSGFDVPEPTVKSGSFSLGVSTSNGGVWSLRSTLYCGQTIVVTPSPLLIHAPQCAASLCVQILSVVSKLLDSPKRALPLGAWFFYNWFVFLSNVAPGPNALSLDPATWKEVRWFTCLEKYLYAHWPSRHLWLGPPA